MPDEHGHHAERYWGDIVTEDVMLGRDCHWRKVCDRLHGDLIVRWLGASRFRRALKIDLRDEALGDGLIPVLAGIAEQVEGVDLSPDVIAQARPRALHRSPARRRKRSRHMSRTSAPSVCRTRLPLDTISAAAGITTS